MILHRHRWVSVSVDQAHEMRDPISRRDAAATVVLSRCRCGDAKTDLLRGTWTKEDVGVNDRAVADLMKILELTEPEE